VNIQKGKLCTPRHTVCDRMFFMTDTSIYKMCSVISGTCAKGLSEAREHAGDVSPQAGQPEEAGGQADTACAAGGPQARGAHKVAVPLPR
jgi:hypothetical protein